MKLSQHGETHLAMGQKPVPPVNIPIPTKIGSKLGGEFTEHPKMGSQNGFDHHSHFAWELPRMSGRNVTVARESPMFVFSAPPGNARRGSRPSRLRQQQLPVAPGTNGCKTKPLLSKTLKRQGTFTGERNKYFTCGFVSIDLKWQGTFTGKKNMYLHFSLTPTEKDSPQVQTKVNCAPIRFPCLWSSCAIQLAVFDCFLRGAGLVCVFWQHTAALWPSP